MLAKGTRLRRGHKNAHPDPTALVPGLGDTRFAPLPDTHHVYVASYSVAALLESAFHDAAPPKPRIRAAQLTQWMESAVQLTRDVRLIDLRDDQLAALGIERNQLVATDAAHYLCTRRWAERLRGRAIGGHRTTGLIWNSRQAELHARAIADRPAVQELMTVAPSEVAVIWQDATEPSPLAPAGGGRGRLDHGPGLDFAVDLGAALGITIL